MTPSRTGIDGDFARANREAGFSGQKPPEGPNGEKYTWHHLDDYDPVTGFCTMQLVTRKAHKVNHAGSVKQYENYNGL